MERPCNSDHERAWSSWPQQRRLYWLGHGTVLLRAAREHVKPAQVAPDLSEKARDPIDTAKRALRSIRRQRGVTHYIDLGKTNKRRRDEVDSDEEEGQHTFSRATT